MRVMGEPILAAGVPLQGSAAWQWVAARRAQ